MIVNQVVFEFFLLKFQGFDLFGLFVLSPSDECVAAGQNVYLGPTIHLPRRELCFESHHLYLTHVVNCSLRKRFQNGSHPYVFHTF